jgi:hypothetical protein
MVDQQKTSSPYFLTKHDKSYTSLYRFAQMAYDWYTHGWTPEHIAQITGLQLETVEYALNYFEQENKYGHNTVSAV